MSLNSQFLDGVRKQLPDPNAALLVVRWALPPDGAATPRRGVAGGAAPALAPPAAARLPCLTCPPPSYSLRSSQHSLTFARDPLPASAVMQGGPPGAEGCGDPGAGGLQGPDPDRGRVDGVGRGRAAAADARAGGVRGGAGEERRRRRRGLRGTGALRPGRRRSKGARGAELATWRRPGTRCCAHGRRRGSGGGRPSLVAAAAALCLGDKASRKVMPTPVGA